MDNILLRNVVTRIIYKKVINDKILNLIPTDLQLDQYTDLIVKSIADWRNIDLPKEILNRFDDLFKELELMGVDEFLSITAENVDEYKADVNHAVTVIMEAMKTKCGIRKIVDAVVDTVQEGLITKEVFISYRTLNSEVFGIDLNKIDVDKYDDDPLWIINAIVDQKID